MILMHFLFVVGIGSGHRYTRWFQTFSGLGCVFCKNPGREMVSGAPQHGYEHGEDKGSDINGPRRQQRRTRIGLKVT